MIDQTDVFLQINNTLLIDVNQEAPAAAQASSNIVRCTFAAPAMAVLQNILDAMGSGWTFTLLGLLCLISIGLCLLIRTKEMKWRLGKEPGPRYSSTGTPPHPVKMDTIAKASKRRVCEPDHIAEKDSDIVPIAGKASRVF